LARVGQSRTIALTVPSFSLIPLAVLHSELVATVPARAARAFAPAALRIVRPPLALPPIRVRQIWHRGADSDASLTLMRGVMRELL
jgi:DNA-binding transcriptional LysR family regulator